MDFMDISSLDVAYRYVVKIKHKFKQKKRKFNFTNSSQQKQGKDCPKPQNEGQNKYGPPQGNYSKPHRKKGNEKENKDTRMWCEFHKISWHNTDECCLKQSLVAELKYSEL
jgi:hypothetical protein